MYTETEPFALRLTHPHCGYFILLCIFMWTFSDLAGVTPCLITNIGLYTLPSFFSSFLPPFSSDLAGVTHVLVDEVRRREERREEQHAVCCVWCAVCGMRCGV